VKIVVCIPARFASTRFPAKVLAKDTGKYLVQHVWEKACRAKLPHKVIIATDDSRVVDAAKSFGAEAVLTSRDCASGTDRIAEAIESLDVDIVINLQGDEPEIEPSSIDFLANLMLEAQSSKLKTKNYGMATLAAPFQNADQIADPSIVKVIVAYSVERTAGRIKLKTQNSKLKTDCGSAIYFSRSVIPYDRQHGGVGPIKNYLRHLGIYAYRKDFLLKITKLPPSMLEKTESLEQLRGIENGFTILVGIVDKASTGIDTPDQYAEFVKRYKKAKN
jgi:3-deoxy-manno-octulosonate cytidylyltransferase (CMP-KDO synthetase)